MRRERGEIMFDQWTRSVPIQSILVFFPPLLLYPQFLFHVQPSQNLKNKLICGVKRREMPILSNEFKWCGNVCKKRGKQLVPDNSFLEEASWDFLPTENKEFTEEPTDQLEKLSSVSLPFHFPFHEKISSSFSSFSSLNFLLLWSHPGCCGFKTSLVIHEEDRKEWEDVMIVVGEKGGGKKMKYSWLSVVGRVMKEEMWILCLGSSSSYDETGNGSRLKGIKCI